MNPGLKSGFGASTASRTAAVQPISKTTAVRVDKLAGLIVTNNESMTTGTTRDFIVNNAFFKVGDLVMVQMLPSNVYPGVGTHTVSIPAQVAVKDGQFTIRVANNSGSTWAAALPISFAIISLGGV